MFFMQYIHDFFLFYQFSVVSLHILDSGMYKTWCLVAHLHAYLGIMIGYVYVLVLACDFLIKTSLLLIKLLVKEPLGVS